MRIRAYGSMHTALSTHCNTSSLKHTCQKTSTPLCSPYAFTRIFNWYRVCYTRNGNDNCGYFCSANRILAQTRGIILMNGAKDCGLLWARGQRLDSVLFSQSDNRHNYYKIQARGQCQAHLQHHSRHISHALLVYEVKHGWFLISLTLW
jgi:hypothetical protein